MESNIIHIGLVTHVSGTLATIWVFPTNYSRTPEIKVDFQQRKFPLVLGMWVYLKSDEEGRPRYKAISEDDIPLETVVDSRNIVNVKSKVIFAKMGCEKFGNNIITHAWSPDFGFVGASSALRYISDSFVYEVYLERVRKRSTTASPFYWSITRSASIERIDRFTFDSLSAPLEHRVVINCGIIVDETRDSWIVWSRVSGKTKLPKECGHELALSQWLSYPMTLPRCGEPKPVIKIYEKMSPPLTSRFEDGKVKVRISDEFPMFRSSYIGYVKHSAEAWAVWDGKLWSMDSPAAIQCAHLEPQIINHIAQGFAAKVDDKLVFLGLNGTADAVFEQKNYSCGTAIEQGDWVTVEIIMDESKGVRIGRNPQKMIRAPLPSRLNSKQEVEVQTFVRNFRDINNERFGQSKELGLVADIYDVSRGKSRSTYLAWCRRVIQPIENECFWALVKEESLQEIDVGPDEMDNAISVQSQEQVSKNGLRESDKSHPSEITTAAELLECIRRVISCDEVRRVMRYANPELHSEMVTMFGNL